MADYKWPEEEKRTHLGKRVSRIDGAEKVSGKAKYTYDINRPGMLYGKVVRSKYAHAKIVSIDTSAAEKMPGVKAVHVIIEPGSEVRWEGEEIVAVAAVDEPTAEDAARAIKIKYEKLGHNVNDTDPKAVGDNARPPNVQTQGDADNAFKEAEVTVEGFYGLTSITHCCLESHGSINEWESDKNLLVHISTQAVSGVAGQMAGPLETPAGSIRVKQDHIGGGFGSKFGPDRWDITGARLSKKAGGKPVKIMLERDAELMVAGMRPPAYARVKLGAMKDGRVVAWESESWASGGLGGGGSPPIPYVFVIPNQKKVHTAIATNVGSARAWRAPNHPQACLITMAALEDLAAKLNMDPYDFFLKNIDLTGARADVYRQEMKIAADLIGWKERWHPRGDKTAGPVKRGLGLSIHTWGGGGHASDCDITIQPDGSVEVEDGHAGPRRRDPHGAEDSCRRHFCNPSQFGKRVDRR